MHMLGICYVTHASEPAGTDWDRMISVFKGTGLWQCITTEPLSCINKKTGQISLGRVRKALTPKRILSEISDFATSRRVTRQRPVAQNSVFRVRAQR